IAEIGSLSERRIAVLVDPKMSGLPAFLVENSGVNSGFMIAQVTAAALVAEQGIDFHRPARSSASLEQVHAGIRGEVPFYAADRYFAPDIRAAQSWVNAGRFSPLVERILPSRPG